MTEPPILEARGLCRVFTERRAFRGATHVHALRDVSFSVPRAGIVALVGESGSGKSTVARVVARLLRPTSGALLLDGVDVAAERRRHADLAYRKRVQMVFQDPFGSLNPVHRVEHHLARPLLRHGLAKSPAELRERVDELLVSVGLNPAREAAAKRPHEMSGGQRQRVAIARALAVEPELILADEPTSMLDVSIRMGVLNLLQQLRAERGLSFLYITHDLASARYLADRTIVLYAGAIMEEGPSEEVMTHPAHPYTQLLLSAVPDPRRRHALASLPGASVPATERTRAGAALRLHGASKTAAGCPFLPRCPRAVGACAESLPALAEVDAGHAVRCHVAGGALQPGTGASPSEPRDLGDSLPPLPAPPEGNPQRLPAQYEESRP